MFYKQFCALALVALATVSWAAAKPNFSGDWQLNLAKSNYGSMPPPTSMVRTITHADPSLEIVDDRNGPGRSGVSSRKYMTSGQDDEFRGQWRPGGRHRGVGRQLLGGHHQGVERGLGLQGQDVAVGGWQAADQRCADRVRTRSGTGQAGVRSPVASIDRRTALRPHIHHKR